MDPNPKEMPPKATFLGKHLPSSQEKWGDDKLKKAHDLVTSEEVKAIATKNDLQTIEDQFTL